MLKREVSPQLAVMVQWCAPIAVCEKGGSMKTPLSAAAEGR